jgi:uncharacterized OB-fold protein
METNVEKKKISVIEGWFTTDKKEPNLIGNRCRSCGDYFFPKAFTCRNPNCMGEDLEEVFLSRQGKLWSCTNNYYQPPPPYVPPGDFEPYTIVVVNLPKEKLMVMGQLASGNRFEDLKIGMEMELVVETLFVDDQGNEHMIWKWAPV